MLNVGLVKRRGSADYHFENIELITDLPRHWIKPEQSHTIWQAFPPAFADFVAARLARIDQPTTVYTDPDVSLELDGLFLGKLQIVSSLSAQQDQVFVFRFAEVSGSVAVLLNNVKHRITQEKQDIAVEALETVVSRAYNVAYLAADLTSPEEQSSFAACIRSIEQKRDELLFRLRLLNRAVTQPEDGQTTSPQALLRNSASAL